MTDERTAASRYKKQAEDARLAIDAGIAPRATPPAPVKSAATRYVYENAVRRLLRRLTGRV